MSAVVPVGLASSQGASEGIYYTQAQGIRRYILWYNAGHGITGYGMVWHGMV